MKLSTDSKERKRTPFVTGCVDYFPLALAAVARVSFKGNQKHNPGQPLHWSRDKSTDHADCIGRHLAERYDINPDSGELHAAHIAWRALALLQLAEEDRLNPNQTNSPNRSDDGKVPINPDHPLPSDEWTKRAKKASPGFAIDDRPRANVWDALCRLGCQPDVARLIAKGVTFSNYDYSGSTARPFVYVAGPMRGKPDFNFPLFDEARDHLVSLGCNVISPADIDRADPEKASDQAKFAMRDFHALHFLKTGCANGQIHMLPGWESSVGAAAEYHIAQWLKLTIKFYVPRPQEKK